jgi:2-polyprenyl-6-methoxyphenol hydroxylase-like FAD-dependent oxidoreductase
VALLCRREVFERVLRASAATEPGVTVLAGHVDEVVRESGRAAGVRLGGRDLAGDLVIDASGRASRLTREIRGPGVGGDCGAAYVSRYYRLRPGAEPGPINWLSGWAGNYPGYWAVVFLHDNRTFSVLVVYHGADRQLRALRNAAVFDAAMRAIPAFAEWTDAGRSQPITEVLPGGKLYNSYRGQLDRSGRLALPGMISVGDAVCTTTPLAGRGVAMSFMQARALLRLLDERPRDVDSAAAAFDHWCAQHIKPWFDDHSYSDADRVRRWSGQDVDLTRPLPSDLIVAAAEADPGLHGVVDPFVGMLALPDSLAAVEPRARAIYAAGWRPPVPAGPGRDELAELGMRVLATAA